MDQFSYEKAFELAAVLSPKMDKYFHHGSCDGSLFVAPADQENFLTFWRKNHDVLTHMHDYAVNRRLLQGIRCSAYSVCFYYIDDNEWRCFISKYNPDRDEWNCYCTLS